MPLQNLSSPLLNCPSMPPPTPTGTKRPALLPPFEPLSSPSLPPSKRNRSSPSYPTPAPTSSTGLLSSPPYRTNSLAAALRAARNPQKPRGDGVNQTRAFTVTRATASPERLPLATVPSVTLSASGKTLKIGRSSNSSDYQLPANRHISRVHLSARFIMGTSPLSPHRIEIICIGWNGFDVHCQGRTYSLLRGDSFACEDMSAPILLNVHEFRVLLQWPKIPDALEDDEEEDEEDWTSPSPSARRSKVLTSAAEDGSPLASVGRMRSPDSPSPEARADEVEIYEDDPELPPVRQCTAEINDPREIATEAIDPDATVLVSNSGSSDLSDVSDAENDPIVHSFIGFSDGPLFSDLPGPMMPSIENDEEPNVKEESPEPVQKENTPPRHPLTPEISHHAVNQLAFSRLSSTPLSIILANLPPSAREHFSTMALTDILRDISCVGIIERHGKDAAGKPLEAEYYYIPEADDDEERRDVVSEMRKPSLRACRKQHKQYFWKRPKTP